MLFTGVQVNYFFVCKRKLWLFSHNVGMEKESEAVKIGKLLHEETYKTIEKDVLFDRISLDFIEKGGKIIIHEIKKSQKMEKAHYYQLLYYIYFLKKKGIEAEGIINYPLVKKKEVVKLENEKEIEEILQQIKEIISLPSPPKAEKKKYCYRCAYFEFCWVD